MSQETTQANESPTPRHGASLMASAAWLTLARIASFAMGFALPLLLVRRLDQTALGLYKQVFQVVNDATTILPFGITMSAFYYLAREEAAKRRKIVFNIVLFHIFVGVVALLTLTFAPGLLSRVFSSPELKPLAPHIGVLVFFWLLGGLIDTIAIANNEAKLAMVFIILAQLSKTALLLAAGIMFGTVEALIYAGIAHSFVQALIVFGYLHSRFPHFWRAFDFSTLRGQLAYALPLGGAGLLYTLQHSMDNYFVSHYFGAAVFAIYAIGCFELPLIGTLGDSVGAVLITRISYLQKINARREIVLQTARVMRKLSALYLPMFAFLFVMSRELIVLLFTAQYVESARIYAVNLLMLPFYILPYDPIIRAYTTEGRFILKLRIALLPGLLTALWLAMTRGRLVAVISVVVAFHIIEKAIIVARLKRLLELTRRDLLLIKDVGRFAAAATIAGLATEILRLVLHDAHPFVALMCGGIVFGIVYVALVRLLNIVTPEERAELMNYVMLLPRRFFKGRAKPETVIIEPLIHRLRD
ncbi:MAG: hypothetical protein NVSMB56_17370 [Pyrinomonadaceae bacterium]